MPTADERINLIREKVKRAKEHVVNLQAETQAFFAGKPYAVGTKRDPQTRRLIYYIASVRQTPIRIPLIAGDAIQNLRSALDHLAFTLVEMRGFADRNGVPLTEREKRDISFPIIDTDDPLKYETARAGKVKGMAQGAIDVIDATKPYKGGDDCLWRLHRLNNVDKHRALLTAGSAYQSVDIGPTIHRTWQESFPDSPFGEIPIPAFTLFLRPADILFPLKQGDELFIDMPDAEVNEKVQFTFNIAFSEPEVIEGEPLLETISGMADRVDSLILDFRPVLT